MVSKSDHLVKLGKLFSYFECKGFLSKRENQLSLGYLGSQIKRNVTSDWLRSVQHTENFYIMPGLKPINKYDIFNFYSSSSKLLQNQEPFGYFHTTKSENLLNSSLCDNGFYNDWDKNNLLVLQLLFFCNLKKTMHWFDYWSRKRLSWWRKFSGMPANFQFGDLVSNVEQQEISINLNLNEHQVPVEVISSFGPLPLLKMSNLDTRNRNLHLITCETLAENVSLSLLVDAYDDRGPNSKLRLNSSIAPFKTTMAVEICSDMDINNKLRDLATFISTDLSKMDIFNFPNPNIFTGKLTLTEQFETFDEIGIPYVIVVKETVLKTGIIGLRNRDSKLQEQVHVSEIKNLLSRYLQISN